MSTIIGTPLGSSSAYVLPQFLKNQTQVQKAYPVGKILFATDEPDFYTELAGKLNESGLNYELVFYQTEKPAYAKSKIWSITAGREAIRCRFLEQNEADKLLFLDADMLFEPNVVQIVEEQMGNHSAVFSGYRYRNDSVGLTGAGCLLIKRKALETIHFRCYEFKNGQTINEDSVFEMDLFQKGFHTRKGFFVKIDHYASHALVKHIEPQPVGFVKKITNSDLFRFLVIKMSILLHVNLAARLQDLLLRFQ